MISYLESRKILECIGRDKGLSSETVFTQNALGRILDQDIESLEDSPPFSNSAMDGFAVRAEDTVHASEDSPVRLKVGSILSAGDSPNLDKIRSFETIEIMTGAVLPESFNAVVKVEDVQRERVVHDNDAYIKISKPIPKDCNVRKKGSDIFSGQIIKTKNTKFTYEHLLLCANLGISKVKVKKKPRVSVISTGSELIEPFSDKILSCGQIRNSTAPFLVEKLKNIGAEVEFLGVVNDDPAEFEKLIQQSLEMGVDLIITTGAVSMGKFDFIKDTVTVMGAKNLFHKVAIRPGKPVYCAVFDQKKNMPLLLGMPGNPVSTLVGEKFFIEPLINQMFCLKKNSPLQAQLAESIKKPDGLRCFYRGIGFYEGNMYKVKILENQASYVVHNLTQSNVWVELNEGGDHAKTGDLVNVYPFAEE